MAAQFLGNEGFSEFAVARRTIALLYPVPLLGFGVALPRFVGFAVGRGDGRSVDRYLGASLWCVGSATIICTGLINIFAKDFSYVFFGHTRYANLAFPLSLSLAGLTIHAVVYSYFRGRLLMRRANMLHLVNLGLVPPSAFLFFHNSLPAVLVAMGLFTLAVAGIAFLFTPWQVALKSGFAEAKSLLAYGAQRVPGDFVHMALLAFPATLVAHQNGVKDAGYVAFGISVISMIGTVFTPISLVLLPKASRMLGEGAYKELRAHVVQVGSLTLLVSAAITLLMIPFIQQGIYVYLGSGFDDLAQALRIVVLGAIPYSLFYVLRGLIDAFHRNAVTGLILLGAFVSFCGAVALVSLLAPSLNSVLYSFVFCLVVLGALCTWECRRILQMRAEG